MSPRSGLPIFLAAALVGCHRANMDVQPRVKPLSPDAFFSDGRSARPLPAGIVARGDGALDDSFEYGSRDGKEIDELPVPLTSGLLIRGRQRFEIYCAPCHDRTGSGDGMIVRRGFPHPPSFHIDRLRKAPLGHFVGAMANGFGTMYPYADRVSAQDRWAIAAYIRALQLSRSARLSQLPADVRHRLEAEPE